MHDLHKELKLFIRGSFPKSFERHNTIFESNPIWHRFNEMESQLWLDTGNISEIAHYWTRDFSAVTTNNTLLNHEIQTGKYDAVIHDVATMLAEHHLTGPESLLEFSFALNAYHALKLVEQFDCRVSVEEHTSLAGDINSAVEYGLRYHSVCPEKIIVKVPFTPAGLLTARKLSAQGVHVNLTLGFSARQNYIAARIANPDFVNVFMGRLNVFVSENDLGDGTYVGEKATLASQLMLRQLRYETKTNAKQIGASFRSGRSVADLAGIDVLTIPPKIAGEFLSMDFAPQEIIDRTDQQYSPSLKPAFDPKTIGLDSLWDVPDRLVTCVDALERENIDTFTAHDLVTFFRQHHCDDILMHWNDEQIQTIHADGKIPRYSTWADMLASGKVGLDALMNVAGLYSFAADQADMDRKIAEVLAGTVA